MPFTLTMPKLSPTMEEGTITEWHKKEGDQIEAGDLLFEVSTDKATVEYNSLDDGWLRKIIVPANQSAVVNQPVAILTEAKDESIEGYQLEGETGSTPVHKESKQESDLNKQKVSSRGQLQSTIPTVDDRLLASPLAKKIAKDQGLNLKGIEGSGPRGRIMSRDLKSAVKSDKSIESAITAGSYTTELLSPMRKVIAQRLVEAKTTIPHFYVQHTFDAKPLMGLKDQLKTLDINVSINDCVVKACALALRQHPEVNSGFNSRDNTLIRFQTIDIAIAVSIEGGLITPIVPHADLKSLQELSLTIKSLAKKAKEGKLDPKEYQGGSFTVSNLGMYGVTNFQAIINPPHAAILAVSGIIDAAVIEEGQVVAGKIMNVTLSADHRVIDGITSAKYLNTLKKYIENPVSLLL